MKASFLNLDINANYREFDTQLCNKKDAFHFCIIRMLYRNSTRPTGIFYDAVGSEIVPRASITSSKEEFSETHNNSFNKYA